MKYYKCNYCGRIFKSESTPDIPHNCNHGFRKRYLEFTEARILDLPLKACWYNMIESGEKKEEYREIKTYWQNRLMACYQHGFCRHRKCNECIDIPWLSVDKHFDVVRFRYGYTKRTMLFMINGISIGIGKSEWGAPNYPVFCIKLGKIIERWN